MAKEMVLEVKEPIMKMENLVTVPMAKGISNKKIRILWKKNMTMEQNTKD